MDPALDWTRINVVPGCGAVVPGVCRIGATHGLYRCMYDESCSVHRPSSHHMRGWAMAWDAPMFTLLRLCPHGRLHPDPDDQAHRVRKGREYIHECDGCCTAPATLDA